MLRSLTEAFSLLYIMYMSDAIKQQCVNTLGKYDNKKNKKPQTVKGMKELSKQRQCQELLGFFQWEISVCQISLSLTISTTEVIKKNKDTYSPFSFPLTIKVAKAYPRQN